MVQVFATHDVLRPTREVSGMPVEYVYYFEYNNLRREHEDLLEALEDYKKAKVRLFRKEQIDSLEDRIDNSCGCI